MRVLQWVVWVTGLGYGIYPLSLPLFSGDLRYSGRPQRNTAMQQAITLGLHYIINYLKVT